ncbi:MAG TPA: hypothetical protein VF070_33830 [Streptosporangiaceae bacterium]
MSTGLTEGSERAAPGQGDVGGTGSPRRFWRWCQRHPRVVWAAGLALAALVLFLLYLRDAQTVAPSSDSGGIALQAWDLWHGNPILRGWWLSDECFYGVDLPVQAVAEMAAGLRPGAVHLLAAVQYTAVVLLAALLARGRARGREGIVRALLAAGIMLAPSVHLGSRVLLQGPDHVGTQIAVLATFLVLDRAPQRWWAPVAVGVLLTWAQVNDVQATFSAAAAVAVACGVRACAEVARSQRPPRERWYDASLVVAALVSFALAHLIVSGIHAAGGFYVPGPKNGLGFAPISAMPAQSWATVYNVLILFGADFIGQPMGISAIFALLHLVGVALGFGALWLGLRGFFTRMDRVNQALVAGTVFILVAGTFGLYSGAVIGAHDIIPVLPFCAVLAGRLLGPRLAALRLEPVLAAGLVVMLAALGYNDIQPKAAPPSTQLAGWLEAHHLTMGLGGYWESNITTLDSGGRVRVVSTVNNGTTAQAYESSAEWFNPARYQANFIVSYSRSTDPSPVKPSVVRAWYGTPAHVYHFEDYTIMVYDYNLLTRVTVPAQ